MREKDCKNKASLAHLRSEISNLHQRLEKAMLNIKDYHCKKRGRRCWKECGRAGWRSSINPRSSKMHLSQMRRFAMSFQKPCFMLGKRKRLQRTSGTNDGRCLSSEWQPLASGDEGVLP
ncbi:UNVERIFIED_CONTAM: hypothetical protein Sindi_1976000 [Sesamum indicum]